MQLEGDGGGAQCLAEFLFGRLLVNEIFRHQSVVGLRDFFDEVVAPFFVAFFFFRGDGLFDDRVAAVFVVADVVIDGDAAEEIDHALEGAGLSDGDLDGDGGRAEALTDGVEAEIEVGTDLVHLVDEAKTGDFVLGGLAPDGFGLGFDAFLAVEDGDRAVEDAQ